MKEIDQFTPCRKCFNKNKQFPLGYIVKKLDCGQEIIIECQCHKNYVEEQLSRIRYIQAGGNLQFYNYEFEKDYVRTGLHASSDDVHLWVPKYVDMFPTSERVRAAIVYFQGDNGTQKTTVAYYILRKILEKRYSAKYLLMNDLIKLLIKAERDEDVVEEIEFLADCDLLIIDEAFMKNKVTLYQSKFQLPFLDSFIRNRVNKQKGIIFISNKEHYNISAEGFSDDIQDLVTRQIKIDKSNISFWIKYLENKKIINDEGLFSVK